MKTYLHFFCPVKSFFCRITFKNDEICFVFSFLQLEDDIVARPNYFTTMKNFALQQPSEEWMILEFSQLGFIGQFGFI